MSLLSGCLNYRDRVTCEQERSILFGTASHEHLATLGQTGFSRLKPATCSLAPAWEWQVSGREVPALKVGAFCRGYKVSYYLGSEIKASLFVGH